jgi:hypothetical protein
MQFNPELYPVQDYKFISSSSLGIIAREYEVTQLVQLLQTMGQDSPLYVTLVQSIIDNMNLSNREDLIAQIQQAAQPDPQAQQMQQAQAQLQLQQAQLQLEYMQAQVAEINSRVQQNNVETQLLPFDAESERIRSMSVGMRDEDPTQTDFENKTKVAELALKEKDLNIKAEAMRNQLRMATMKGGK